MITKEYLQGYKQAIEDLRKVDKKLNHVKKWSHSRELKFAPVELSDVLVRSYLNLLDKEVK